MKYRDEIISITRRLTQAVGLAGREDQAALAAMELLRPLGEPRLSPLGSVICTVCPGRPGHPHIMLEAHLDQVGMIVTRVEDGGFLRVANAGGLDRRLLPSSPVTIHAAQGEFGGIVVSVPPHLAGGDEKPLKMEDVLVDTGFETQRARELFAPGDSVSLDGPMELMEGGRLRSRALDDRIGCAAVILAARELHAADPGCKVTVVLASMEESSGVGAATAAFEVDPDMALAVDVSFGDGFGVPAWKCGKMGEGPMIGIAPVLDQKIFAALKDLASRLGIPFQTEVMGGRTGTDADKIAAAGKGRAVGLISIPLRNMHTPVETVCLEDVENTARLMAAFVEEASGK